MTVTTKREADYHRKMFDTEAQAIQQLSVDGYAFDARRKSYTKGRMYISFKELHLGQCKGGKWIATRA